MDVFILFALSTQVYELQRCIIPHFKALDLSFWHSKVNFGPRLKTLKLWSNKCVLLSLVQALSPLKVPQPSYVAVKATRIQLTTTAFARRIIIASQQELPVSGRGFKWWLVGSKKAGFFSFLMAKYDPNQKLLLGHATWLSEEFPKLNFNLYL